MSVILPAILPDMSNKIPAGDPRSPGEAAPRWLTDSEQRAWTGYRRMRTLLDLQLARDLNRDSGLSAPDYDVLSTLSESADSRWRAGDLAQRLSWSTSRLTHHVNRMTARGLVANVALAVLPAPAGLGTRVLLLAAGIGLNAVATALYIGAGLGPGPRDGIMTGLAARGHSVRVVRTAIEICVIAVGYPLGGSVGPGTLAYALLIGPLVHLLLPRLAVPPARMEGRSS